MVYPGTPQKSGRCIELLPDMVPLAAAAQIKGAPASCTIEAPDTLRLDLSHVGGPEWYLAQVEIPVIGSLSYPTPAPPSPGQGNPGLPECVAVVSRLLAASADTSQRGPTVICGVEPHVRGQPKKQPVEIWSLLPIGQPRPATTPECWQMPIYLGSSLESEAEPILCTLVD
jgi:hypothetical protein